MCLQLKDDCGRSHDDLHQDTNGNTQNRDVSNQKYEDVQIFHTCLNAQALQAQGRKEDLLSVQSLEFKLIFIPSKNNNFLP